MTRWGYAGNRARDSKFLMGDYMIFPGQRGRYNPIGSSLLSIATSECLCNAARIYSEAMHIQNSASGLGPSRSLSFSSCFWRTRESANSVTSFDPTTPHPPTTTLSARRTRQDRRSTHSVPPLTFPLLPLSDPPTRTYGRTDVRDPPFGSFIPLLVVSRALHVLTPRCMSEVMNFNSFTPPRCREGERSTGKNGVDEFFARQIVDGFD